MKLYKCFPYYYCKCKIKFNQYKGKQLNFCLIYFFLTPHSSQASDYSLALTTMKKLLATS